MDRNRWNDRPVKFADFSLGVGDEIIEAYNKDAKAARYLVLVHSLRYADDDTPVFASVEEVLAQPFRLHDRIGYLAGKCSFANGMRQTDPDAEVADDAQPNGHAGGDASRPSP